MEKPLILLTNDDGITAPGLRTLVKIAESIGQVVVVAPDSPQSGKGHAITVDSTLTLKKMKTPKSDVGTIEYSCSGTPADCVKLAIHEILDRKPDIVLSGINHGSNASINVIYSGTMSAVIEAGIEGIPAIGFSLCDYSWNANFKPSEKWVKEIILKALAEGIPERTVLNVNIPDLRDQEPKGIKICRQASGNWVEQFDRRVSPTGKEYYWLSGRFDLQDQGEDSDIHALESGYISMVPTQFDLTAHDKINQLKNWHLNVTP